MNRIAAYLVLATVIGVPLTAGALDTSLRPQERPFAVRYVAPSGQDDPGARSLRPVARPGGETSAAVIQPVSVSQIPTATPAVAVAAVATPAIRPQARDADMIERALFKRKKRKKKRGSVCGDRDIRGEEVGRVPGKINGCGLKDAVRITEVADVKLSQSAVVDCTTARALNRWVETSVHKAFRRHGRVVGLRVAAHYACRTRNNQPGAKISEHGRGRAIDISGIVLESGEVVTVANGWGAKKTRKAMRRVHYDACGMFGTVLGPNADRFHRDHFHLDTARHRGGAYCR